LLNKEYLLDFCGNKWPSCFLYVIINTADCSHLIKHRK
jgi:hypothetical protein